MLVEKPESEFSNKRQKKDNSAEERALEELLFGKPSSSSASQSDYRKTSAQDDKEDDNEEYEDINFTIDTAGDQTIVAKHSDGPAWHDEDDNDIVIDLNQVNRLKKLKTSDKNKSMKSLVSGNEYTELLKERFDQGSTKNFWANSAFLNPKKSDDDILDDEDYQILQEAETMTKKRTNNKWLPLPDGKLTIHRLQDVNYDEPANTAITATHFHRNNELVLVASDDKNLRLFKINEETAKNTKTLGIQFNDLSIKQAKFTGTQHQELAVCGRRPYYYSYDLTSGQVSKIPKSPSMETPTLEHMTVSPEGTRLGFIGSHGYVHIADSNSKQWIVDFKMNCTLRSMSFLNENTCITSGYDAEIYLWDIRYPNGKCISKFNHEDGTATSFISSYLPPAAINQTSSGKQQNNFFALTSPYLSIGALSGVNSVFEGSYDNQSGYYQFSPSNVVGATPKPLKSIMNLTTRISQSAFHPSGQILAIASNVKKDQLKLVHLPSASVFPNWPLNTTPLHIVETLEFSPNGKYLSIGNRRGKVLLYQINHFV